MITPQRGCNVLCRLAKARRAACTLRQRRKLDNIAARNEKALLKVLQENPANLPETTPGVFLLRLKLRYNQASHSRLDRSVFQDLTDANIECARYLTCNRIGNHAQESRTCDCVHTKFLAVSLEALLSWDKHALCIHYQKTQWATNRTTQTSLSTVLKHR